MPADDIPRGDRRICATTGLAAKLARRLDKEGRPIRVDLIGSGEMGANIDTQCRQMTDITGATISQRAHPRVRQRMHDLKLGPDPCCTLCRPYRLTNLEVPLCCVCAALYPAADMEPLHVTSAEVCALAKKDLQPGKRLDAIGGYNCRVMPRGLIEIGKVTKPMRKGQHHADHTCAVHAAALTVAPRQRQDDMLKGSVR